MLQLIFSLSAHEFLVTEHIQHVEYSTDAASKISTDLSPILHHSTKDFIWYIDGSSR